MNDVYGHFLEIDITIHSEKFRTKIFDKRNEFAFKSVKYPDTRSNIPECLQCFFCAQIVTYIRVCPHFQDFLACFQILLQNFLSKGCNINILKAKLKKTLFTHKLTFCKYNITLTEFLDITLYLEYKLFLNALVSRENIDIMLILNCLRVCMGSDYARVVC